MRRTVVAIAACCSLAPAVHGDVVSIAASRDATLYQSSDGSLANGAGQYLFAGKTNQNLARRAVIWFDIAAFVPTGATVTSVRLILNVTQCSRGHVRGDYQAGRALAEAGVIAGGDLTSEAAMAKLALVLGQRACSGWTRDVQVRLLQTPLRGEMSG